MLLIIGGRYLTFSSIYGIRLYWILGAVLGVRLALLKGNEFVRGLLRIIVFLTILKLAYQVATDYLF